MVACFPTVFGDISDLEQVHYPLINIFASIDASADKMYRQIERFKGKRYQGKRRASAAVNAEVERAATAVAEEIAEEDEGRIIRRKEFSLEPMNEDEAVEQMELLGHDFYVYYDVEAARVGGLASVASERHRPMALEVRAVTPFKQRAASRRPVPASPRKASRSGAKGNRLDRAPSPNRTW